MSEIDNPGGGDCAFYAFAIGLIDIIQREYQEAGDSLIFARWQNLGLGDVSLKELLKIDLYQLSESPRTYSRVLLKKLQNSLRAITAYTWKEELLDKITRESNISSNASIIEGSPTYGKFMELVQAHMQVSPSRRMLKEIGKFNELALSFDCIQLAEITARSLQVYIQGKSFAEKQIIENSLVKRALLTDVIKQNGINTDSAVLTSIDLISRNGRWGTHSDLKEIASKFNVNLNISNQLNGKMMVELPTITLHNISDVHWTTEVDLPLPKQKATQRTATKTLNYKKRQRDNESCEELYDELMSQRKSSRITLQQSCRRNCSYSLADKILFFSNKQIEDFDAGISEECQYEPVSTRLRERKQTPENVSNIKGLL